jgi:hypothetical protein
MTLQLKGLRCVIGVTERAAFPARHDGLARAVDCHPALGGSDNEIGLSRIERSRSGTADRGRWALRR